MNTTLLHPRIGSWGIKPKFIALSVFVIGCIIVVLASYFITTQTKLYREELEKRGLSIVDNLASNLDVYILLEDRPAIERLSSAILKDEEVVGVEIRGVKDRVLFSNWKKGLPVGQGSNAVSDPSSERSGQSIFRREDLLYLLRDVLSPIGEALHGRGEARQITKRPVIGKVLVCLSLKHTNELIRASIMTTVMLALMITLLSSILIGVILNRFLQPVLTVANGARRLASGELSHRVETDRKDEIGELARAFNEMAKNIERNRNALDEYSQHLEEKVRERTNEIENRTRKVIRNQSVLVDLTRSRYDDLTSSVKRITEAAAETLEVERAGVWLFNKETAEIVCEDIYNLSSKTHERGFTLNTDRYPRYVKALKENSIIAADDARQDVRTSEFTESYLDPFGIVSILDIPVHLHGEMVGVVRCEHKGTPRSWSIEDQDFVNSIAGIVSLAIEASERRRAEEEQRRSEEQFRLLIEGAPDAIFVQTRGRFAYVNPSAIRLFGAESAEQLLEKPVLDRFPPEYHPIVRQRMRTLFKEKKALPVVELKYLRLDGRAVDAESNAVPIDFNNSKGALVFVRDITARKQLEAQLLHAQKMEAIGTLAGGVAHDFNNLLTGILGNATLAKNEVEASGKTYERLQQIEEIVESAAGLTRQLLSFARRDRGEHSASDLNEIVEKSLLIFSRTRRDVIIHRNMDQNLRAAEVDRGQMEQVFMNLFVNAGQAMPGGGYLFIETSNVLLENEDERIPYLKPGSYVKISVSDTGEGMDEKTRQRIFEPFFTTREMGRGTGLGLAIVYGIIKGHQGYISAESEKGKGTTFSIYLPSSDKEILREEKTDAKIERGREGILLVDDERMNLDVTRDFLEMMGYRAFTASNGQQALDIYSEKKEDIQAVLLDMIMPGMSGSETFDGLKKINPDVRVILCSGYSLDGEASKIMRRGCSDFIQKPFNLKELSQKIRDVLDKGKSPQQGK